MTIEDNKGKVSGLGELAQLRGIWREGKQRIGNIPLEIANIRAALGYLRLPDVSRLARHDVRLRALDILVTGPIAGQRRIL